jgi:hypothetical protein
LEIRGSSAFLRIKVMGGQLAPQLSPSPFPPNFSDKNFEIANLLKIVQKSEKKFSGSIKPPEAGAKCLIYPPGANKVFM